MMLKPLSFHLDGVCRTAAIAKPLAQHNHDVSRSFMSSRDNTNGTNAILETKHSNNILFLILTNTTLVFLVMLYHKTVGMFISITEADAIRISMHSQRYDTIH